MTNLPSITVCPACHYGFCDDGSGGAEFICPRSECGHRWEPIGQTIRAVQGTGRRQAVAELTVVAGATPFSRKLTTQTAVIGRDEDCDFVLDNLSVSRRHASITVEGDQATITDLGSSCGTAVNGTYIEQRQQLRPRDRIVVGGTTLQFDVLYSAAPAQKPIADAKSVLRGGVTDAVLFRGRNVRSIPLKTDRITIGRNDDRDIVIFGPLVSLRHAVLERQNNAWFLNDVQTATGTYVNGQPVIREELVSGDRVQIGSVLFRFEGDRLIRIRQHSAISVECRHLTKWLPTTGKEPQTAESRQTLLDDLSFRLEPGDFVGLIGPSGAGKTTLLDALNGLRPATCGITLDMCRRTTSFTRT